WRRRASWLRCDSWAAPFKVVRGPAGSPVYQAAHDRSRTATVRRLSPVRVQNVRVRVLVVEDHVALANRIGEGLRDAGFAVDVVHDGAAALQSTTSTAYDVVVRDRALPALPA